MDEFDGADVDAAGRLANDQDVGITLHLASQNDLLLIATREIGGLEIGIGRTDVELFDMALRLGPSGLDVEHRAFAIILVVAEDGVFPLEEISDQPHADTILGDMG